MTGARVLGPWLAAAFVLGACDAADRTPTPTDARPEALAAVSNDTQAIAFPELTGRVVDRAEILGPEAEARLTEALAALERRTTDQLVIVTLPSLGGRPIEEYARTLGNHWGVGQADKDNGVLLVVVPAERRVRIEVGYGLGPILTNSRASEIIQRDILPPFRDQRMAEGIAAGAAAIIRTLTDHADEPRRGR